MYPAIWLEDTRRTLDGIILSSSMELRLNLSSLVFPAAFTMSGYVATDSSTKEKPPDKYGIEDVVYIKAHGEGRTKLIIDQVVGDGRYEL